MRPSKIAWDGLRSLPDRFGLAEAALPKLVRAMPTGALAGRYAADGTPRTWADPEVLTFGLSLALQLASLVPVSLAVAKEETPSALRVTMALDLSVQVLQFCFYAFVAVLFFTTSIEFSVSVRYWEWSITTPAMLYAVFAYATFSSDPCHVTVDDLTTPGRVVGLVFLVLFDWAMLFVGFVHERRYERATEPLVKPFEDRFYQDERWGLSWGFVCLFLAFFTLVLMVGLPISGAGTLALLGTFLLWNCYGVVAVVYYEDERMRSVLYNCLDLLSKQAVGVFFSWYLLTEQYEDDCGSG